MIVTAVLICFIAYLLISAWTDIKKEDIDRPFTSASYQLLFALILSVIASITIALHADIPDSSGHGGFVYLIMPAIYGLGILVLYIISLLVKPHTKFFLGVLAIVLNIGVGLIVMSTDY